LLFIAALAASCAAAGTDTLPPNANLQADGLPPIPADLAAKVAPYTEFKPATAVGWHPQKRELIVARRAGNTTQLSPTMLRFLSDRQAFKSSKKDTPPASGVPVPAKTEGSRTSRSIER
jgi:hypothetical protein